MADLSKSESIAVKGWMVLRSGWAMTGDNDTTLFDRGNVFDEATGTLQRQWTVRHSTLFFHPASHPAAHCILGYYFVASNIRIDPLDSRFVDSLLSLQLP